MASPFRQFSGIIAGALLAVSVLYPVFPVRGAEPEADAARQTWMPGYLKLEQATAAVRQNNLTLALTLYEEAVAVFKDVRTRYPGWNTDVVSYRVSFCNEQIRLLRHSLESNTDTMSKSDLLAEVKALRAARAANEQALADLKARTSLLETTVGFLEKEKADLQEQLSGREAETRERAAWQKVRRELEARVRDLEDQNRRLVVERNRSTAGLRDAEATRAALEETRRELEGLRERIASVEGLEEKLAALGTQVREGAGTVERLTAELAASRKEGGDLSAANRELEERLGAVIAERDRLRTTGEKVATGLAGLEEELAASRREAENLKTRERILGARVEEAVAAREKLADAQRESAAREEELARRLREAESLRTAAGAGGDEALAKLEALRAERDRARADLAASAEELRALRVPAGVADGPGTAPAGEDELRILRETAAQSSEDIASARREAEELKASNRDLRRRVDELAEREQGLAASAAESALRVRELTGLLDAERGRVRRVSDLSADVAGDSGATRPVLGSAEPDPAGLKERLQEGESALRDRASRVRELEKAVAARDLALASLESERSLLAERERRREAAEAERLAERRTAAAAAEKALTAGDSDAALQALRQLLAADPENAEAVARSGILLADRGDLEEAERYLSRAFELNPANSAVIVRLGSVHLQLGRPKRAAGVLLYGASRFEDDAVAKRLLGIAARHAGWPEIAEQALRESFELDDRNPVTAFNLAVLLANLDAPRIPEARQWYRKARELGAEPDPVMETFFAGE